MALMFKLRALAWGAGTSYDTYSAVENRKKGEVLRKASADGTEASANAPSNVVAMAVMDSGW